MRSLRHEASDGHRCSNSLESTGSHRRRSVRDAQAREAGERIGSVISLAAVRAARQAANAVPAGRDVSKM